jgi:cytochrome c oxidase subunit IV
MSSHDNHHSEPAVNHLAMDQHTYNHHKSDVFKTTIILSIITIVEVGFALYYDAYLVPQGWDKNLLRVFLVVASLLKAYWIMAVFMHVKHERKAMVLTITLPFTLLIWMIISFIWEGNSWSNNRIKRYGDLKAKTEQVAEKKEASHQ